MELPVLRLGLAGFSAAQKQVVEQVLRNAGPRHFMWQIASFMEADAWWINSAKVQTKDSGTLRVGPGVPTDKAIQLDLREVERPFAFSKSDTALPFQPAHLVDLQSVASMSGVLQEFSNWLTPLAAQYCLAAEILRQESVLGSGIFHVTRDKVLLAVVNLRGEIGVSPLATPIDFDNALWTRRSGETGAIPPGFVRTRLSQLMWQYATRTSLDVLPPRYRVGQLFFRRAPRVPQRALKDAHLLLLRELSVSPLTFNALCKRLGLAESELAHHLAALYLVGSITANPSRAANAARTGVAGHGIDAAHSVPPSVLDSDVALRQGEWVEGGSDMTVPAPLSPH